MKRRLFNIFAALSLLLFVVVVALCARSYRIEDHVTPRADFLISSHTGTLTLCHFSNVQVEIPVQHYAAIRRELYASIWRDLWANAERLWRFGGFTYARTNIGGGEGDTLIAIPYWALAAATGALPSMWLLRAYRSRTVRLAGLCRRCGYDLRATPERCPECGAVPAGATT